MSFAPIPPARCPGRFPGPRPRPNKAVYVDARYGQVDLGGVLGAPGVPAAQSCGPGRRTDCAFGCAAGTYVGFTGDLDGGPRYRYVDPLDSLTRTREFLDPATRTARYAGAPDGLVGATGSDRDRSHTVTLSPLPLFFGDVYVPARRLLPGLGAARNATLATDPDTGGAYPLVGPAGLYF